MKYVLTSIAIGLIFGLLGCLPSQAPLQITVTRPITTLATETPLLLVAVTEASPPSTSTPSSIQPTQTPIPPTTAPTITLSSTTNFEPFTQGSIIFLWNQVTPPAPDGPSEFEPTVNLYLAQPGASPEDWQIHPLLTNLRAYSAYLSPDQSKLALLILEDSEQYYNGIYRIHVYAFVDGSLTRIENPDYLDSLSWLADSQSVIYPQDRNLFRIGLDNPSPELLTNYPTPSPEEFDGRIGQLAGSPNGQFQALNVYPDSLAIFDMDTKEMFHIADRLGRDHLILKWSPNNQWLTFTHDFGLSLFVVNVNTLSVSELATEPTSIYYPSWSPDGRWLAFTQSSKLSLWDSETETVRELTSAHYIGVPAWSPNGTTIATGFVEEDRWGILVVDLVSGNRQELVFGMIPSEVFWSPDGEWLLFHAGQNDQTGLYVTNRNGGDPYLVIDTTGKLHTPEYVTWLFDEITPP